MNHSTEKSHTQIESIEFIEGLFELSPDGLALVNGERVIEKVNLNFCEIFGYEECELIGEKIEILMPQRYQETHPKLHGEYTIDPHQRPMGAGLDLYGKRKDGSEFFVDIMLKPLIFQGNQIVLAAVRDITERKKIDEKLSRQREDFVATLTHDLKTPILAANRALNLLIEGDFGAVDSNQRELIETILESNNSMYDMVLTLLDVYKYDSGKKKLNLVPTDLIDVISKLIDELKHLADSKSIDLDLVAPSNCIAVMADKEELRRLLQNLLDNSLKYTASGKIQAIITQSDDETVVSIVDTGKGINEEDMPKLFQRFWQAASSGRYYASTGLGLYLCRQITESHGGNIWCESELGKGSTFSFSLPNA